MPVRTRFCFAPLLLAALTLSGCEIHFTDAGGCGLMGCSGQTYGNGYGDFTVEDVVGFPGEAVAAAGPDGRLWGRILVGDTLRLTVVAHAVRYDPCTSGNTVGGVVWGITPMGYDALRGDTLSARILRADTSSVVIVAVAEGVFGVAFDHAIGYRPDFATYPARTLYACGPGSASSSVELVRVVARGSA